MARKPHKYHYIYKTTCKINGKFYIGMHSTSNLEDGYIGSGKRLWNSIRKHGKENHEFKILEFFPDRSSLKNREREIVNEEMLQDPMCMNLQIGGGGGFSSDGHRKKAQSLGGSSTFKLLCNRHREKLQSDPEYKKRYGQKISESILGERNGFYGKNHSEETKKQIGIKSSLNQKGQKNSQFGTKWITNLVLKRNKKIKSTETIPEGWVSGRKKY
jgi:hypothetical protein